MARRTPNRRWGPADFVLLVALAGALVWLGFEIRRVFVREPGRAAPPPEAGNLCERLADAGDVLALGRDALPRCPARGFRLLAPAEITPDGALERLLSERDDSAVADLLVARGVRRIAISTTLADPKLLPAVTVRNRLALYKPSDRFHAVYLSEAAGLYEIVPGMLELSDEEGAELVRIARAVLAGGDRTVADLPRLSERGDFEVAVQLQGLTPTEILRKPPPEKPNRKPYIRHIRTNVFGAGREETLADATRAAAGRVRALYARRVETVDGPIEEAIPRLTVEVEVMYDWSDVRTLTARAVDTQARWSFLWRAVELGLHGVAINRGTDRYVYRLPSDAVYSGRKGVEEFIERAARDLYATDAGALAAYSRSAGYDNLPLGEAAKTGYTKDAGLAVQRFRTHHFREMTPGGAVRRLSRGVPALPATRENLSRPAIQNAIFWATRWLVENVQPDGRFHYRYLAEYDYYLSDIQIVEDYNEVRHGLATYSLFMSHREIPSADLWAAAEKSLRWILGKVVFGPAWTLDPGARARLPAWWVNDDAFGPPAPNGATGPQGEWLCPHGDVRRIPPEMAYVRHLDNAKVGAVAAAALAIYEMIDRTPEAERPGRLEAYRPFLEGFAAFLLFMQHTSGEHAGRFDHYFVTPDHGHYDRSTTIYPGEILMALARIYRLIGDPRIPPAYAMAHRYWRAWFDRESAIREPDGTYANQRRVDLVQFVPWISMAHHEMYLAVREEDPAMAAEYADFGIAASDWVAREYLFDERRAYFPEYLGGYFKWQYELPAMHSMVYTEGTAAAFHLADLIGDPRREAMRHATVLGCRFAMQQIVVPGLSDHFLPNPKRARGGVRFGINDSDMRTDYSYHTLSALNQTLRYASDDDLAP